MTTFEDALRIKTGDKVRIDGIPMEVGRTVDRGRVFLTTATGVERIISNQLQVSLAREQRIITESAYRALTFGLQEALKTDWDTFSLKQRDVAQWRYRFVKAIGDLPVKDRNKTDKINAAIDAEHAKNGGDRPNARKLKRWRNIYVAAGHDVRALIDLSHLKGRHAQMEDWVRESINKAIDQVYATSPPGTIAETRRRAIDIIRERAELEGRPLPPRAKNQQDVIGYNAVQDVLQTRDQYAIVAAREGPAEADRIFSALGEGPQGEYPLHEVEIDHTLLDIAIIDEVSKSLLGRPWLTVLIDRYSRCICGFCLSFHPPSWTTVMQALNHAVCDKREYIASLPGHVSNEWPCFGAPDVLICDNGRDFHSASMQETEAVLHMRIRYLPRKKGWLKGKIERWFRSLEDEIFHLIPGTTFSNVVKRKDYQSEQLAVMTLTQARFIITKWIVDIYHQRPHSKTGYPPAVRWTEGMHKSAIKFAPDLGLLVPLTGLSHRAHLGPGGIKFSGLSWNSNEFSSLRTRIGTNVEVLVRIDPLDLSHAYAYDEKRRRWIVGDLDTQLIDASTTLHQWEVIKRHARATRLPDENALAAISRSRRELFEYVQGIVEGNKKSKAGKRFARFAKDGRRPSEHIAETVVDADRSSERPRSHPIPSQPKNPPRTQAKIEALVVDEHFKASSEITQSGPPRAPEIGYEPQRPSVDDDGERLVVRRRARD